MTATEPRTYNLPRNVRPSFLTADIDGRKSRLAAGPKSRSGRMGVEVAIRERGGIVDGFASVDAIASADGLTTLVRVTVRGKVVHEERVTQ